MGKLYSKKEIAKIKELNAKGLNRVEIAKHFPDRTFISIRSKIADLGLTVKQTDGEIVTPDTDWKKEAAELKKVMGGLIDENKEYMVQIADLRKRDIIKHPFSGKHIKIGVISDTHKGSLYANQHLEDMIVNYFNKEKVDAVYHCGDMVDGEGMYKGHTYEIEQHGLDKQLAHFVETFPKVNSKLYCIAGNHDTSFFKSAGVDIGRVIDMERDDIEYLGQDQAIIEIKPGARIMLVHPSGGTAYAVSYKSQKLIESFTGGEKPSIVLTGHYHKFDHLFYRNIQAFQVPTTQSQTPYMKRKPTPAIMGGLLLDIWMDKKGISKLKTEYLPYYER